MSESTTQIDAPSLEQILWRSMDRFVEEPALLDAEEFAAHIAHAFEDRVPEEDFADRFFADLDRLHEPRTVAEGVVRRAAERLHVYEFDLNRLEYVIVEDKENLVVVSEFGQFTLRSDDAVGRALEAAVVKLPERSAGEPRGYFVRKSGEVVGVDVKRVARTLERLILQQVSAPAVEAPAQRLASFNPVRQVMTPAREERALRQDPRLSRPLAPAQAEWQAATGAETPPQALVLEMPDGSLVRARIGAANRWEQMLGQRARAARRRISIQAGGVVAIVDGVAPAGAGERALAQGEALVAVRSEALPVRALAGDEVARALVAGARVVPAVEDGGRFWVQPEQAFRPGPAEAPPATLVAQPLQLGQITGDPWADWALTAGGARLRSAAATGQVRGEILSAQLSAGRLRAVPSGQGLQLAGAPAVAFRAPDGTVVLNRAPATVHLAASVRPGPSTTHKTEPDPGAGGSPNVSLTPVPPWSRPGAVPYPVLQTLQVALERTAATRAYKLRVGWSQSAGGDEPGTSGPGALGASASSGMPGLARMPDLVRIQSAPDAIAVGASLKLSVRDERRSRVRMLGPVAIADGTARFLLSMPFPNRGELHVGRDLEAALDTWLAAPVAIAPRPEAGPLLAAREPNFRTAQAFPARRLPDASGALALPSATPLLASDPFISDVPFLFRAAVAQAGDATAAPAQPLVPSLHAVGARAPFADLEIAAPAASRAPRAGEDEIVIPLPLWAQMGRGEISETARIMASPIAQAGGYTPPLGTYQLVVPSGGPLDLAARAAPDVAAVEISGPTGLNVARRPSGSVTAATLGGSHFLGRVPVAESDVPAGTRGRIRIGAPLPRADVSTLVSGAGEPSVPKLSAPSVSALSGSLPAPAAARTSSSSRSVSVVAQPSDLPASSHTPAGIAPDVAWTPRGGALSEAPYPVAGVAPAQKPFAGGLVSSKETVVVGLPPGMWSGHRSGSAADYRLWSYGVRYRDQSQAIGGLELASLSRPRHPQLPIALRFRYAGAPLWWSASTGAVSSGHERESSAAAATQSGVRTANSAASIWRSILVAGAPHEDVTGGMDAGREASAEAMSSVARRLDVSAAPLVAAPAAPTASAGAPAYIAMSASGAAGAVTAGAAARARAQAVEMSIVAAIPPAPPPLESMSTAVRGGEAPHARARVPGQPAAAQEHAKEADDAVSHSKIEGSVDAIAQRIYHRIRRRIQSDRERFGG